MVATNDKGQMMKKPETGGLASLFDARMLAQMQRAVPKHVTGDRMARVALTALRTTKDLAKCTPASFIACVMTLSQLGLEPSNGLGFAYLIPRKNKREGTTECTVILGYQGLMELARRSGQVRSITAHAVYAGDEFLCSYGLAPTLHHVPNWTADRTPKALVGAYAVARIKDSEDPVFVYVPRVDIEARRKRGASGAGVSTPWDTDYEAMSIKTAIRVLWKFLPKSIEMAIAARVDDAPASVVAVASDAANEAILDAGHVPPALDAGDETEAPHDPETGEVAAKDEPPVT